MIDKNMKAFPSISNIGFEQNLITEEGMTLRDYFAGQAISNELPKAKAYQDLKGRMESIAESAYMLEDALLQERNK